MLGCMSMPPPEHMGLAGFGTCWPAETRLQSKLSHRLGFQSLLSHPLDFSPWHPFCPIPTSFGEGSRASEPPPRHPFSGPRVTLLFF